MTALETLQYYFTFPFVRYALVVGVLIALCASLFGVTLVLKRFSFIGDGLSHVAFGALAIASVTIGLLAFVYYCRSLVLRRRGQTWVSRGLAVLLLVELLFLGTTMTLRGLASGHLPLSNGHETMQLLAACALLLAWFFRRRLPLSVSFGFLLGGLALLVSMMGEANPQVSHLMPVLSSPLLSFHVVVIMLAYALLAFVMLNGVTALVCWPSASSSVRCGPTYRGVVTGAGTPRRCGRSSRCWSMPLRYIPLRCLGFAGRCSSMCLPCWLSCACWSRTSG